MIQEGYEKRGGVNKEQKTPRPSDPQAQGINNLKLIECICERCRNFSKENLK